MLFKFFLHKGRFFSLTKDVSLHPDQVCYLDLSLKSTYPVSKMNSISNTSASQVPVMKEPFNWKHVCQPYLNKVKDKPLLKDGLV